MASSLSLVSTQLNYTHLFNGLPCLQDTPLQVKALSSADSPKTPSSLTLISTTFPSATISANYVDVGARGSRATGFVVRRELEGEEEHQTMRLEGRCLIENGLQSEEVAVSHNTNHQQQSPLYKSKQFKSKQV